ncbi:uncharacterized protein A1O5_09926 [Cladophialophora psammophila CBS 110553]|uniref:Glutamate-1-semialdehyde 2,1-aminomutase n=1 Tax=Cladophialophora psammophila CBS 110553 TaxID=1182543 RepID=W9WPY1_9EURO|nr:uncharacterized protein A1O5_09926 [Cladophialophora psammophila CBS 110553]EXJ66731.1 hypothetical protein A1O5_09926 [Cladophialophora psammophila CBS 110553]
MVEVSGYGNLQAVLNNVYKQYAESNPRSLDAYNRSCEVMPGANTRTSIHASPFPLTIERGQSAYLFDVDGHEYLDFLGEFSAGVYGHSSPVIKKAIIEAIEKGWNFGTKNMFEDQLARSLVQRFSNSMELIRFCNSGTEANMMALGAAINFTGKKKILVFSNGYHGSTILFLNGSLKHTMNPPYEFVIAPYNDIAGTDSLVKAIPPNSLAAILVEPMQVSGGCIPGTVDFLRHLRELATTEKALLIFDEIMTSRLDYGGLQVTLGIKPDITTIGKWAGGGMSFGAFGARGEIMEWFDPRSEKLAHAGTFNNNIITMAAGVAGNAIMTKERLTELNALGSNLMAAIAKTIEAGLSVPNGSKTQPKMFVTGRGSLFAIRFSGPESGILRELFYHHLLTNGIFIASRGFLALTLEITEAHCTRMLRVIEEFIAKYGSALL